MLHTVVGIFIGFNIVLLCAGIYAIKLHKTIIDKYAGFLVEVQKVHNSAVIASQEMESRVNDLKLRVEFIQKQKTGQTPLRPA